MSGNNTNLNFGHRSKPLIGALVRWAISTPMNAYRLSSLVGVLAAAVFASGCDSLHQTQYVVANATLNDQKTVKSAVESAASEAGLVDKTDASKVPSTIVYCLEPVPHFPVSLGARVVGDSAVVDLSCFHPGVAKPHAFKIAESNLTAKLTNEFGTRLAMPDVHTKFRSRNEPGQPEH
jgi:hypothetical protein